LEQKAREQQELLITNKKEGKLLYENKSQSEGMHSIKEKDDIFI